MSIARENYTYEEVFAAISKANGQKRKDIMVGGLNGPSASDLGENRNIGVQGKMPYKKSTGHVFAHVDSFLDGSIAPDKAKIRKAQTGKSRWQNRRTCVEAVREVLNGNATVQTNLAEWDSYPTPSQNSWLKKLPLTGDYYGIEANGTYLKKVTTCSVNFCASGFSLFIYSAYPDGFAAGVGVGTDDVPDLSAFFGTDW